MKKLLSLIMAGCVLSSLLIAVATDTASISDYAENAIKWASGTKIMSGNTDGTFAPHSGATRAEAATVFMRVFNLGK